MKLLTTIKTINMENFMPLFKEKDKNDQQYYFKVLFPCVNVRIKQVLERFARVNNRCMVAID